jgi:ISXO2-like transposase domain/Transposase zinc-ribbon domain
MADFPTSLPESGRRFPDEVACAEWLLERRWGSGFACPGCGHDECWRLGRKVLTLQCKACRRETSVAAGTVMHRSHLPVKVWFTAARLVATHRNGMSARQPWLQLGLGGYKSAWLLLRRLRAAMVDPDRGPLAGLVEVDETSLPFRAGGEPVRPGRSHDGKLLLAGAVETKGKGPGRVRLAVIEDYAAASLGGFVAADVADGSTVVSDGWPGCKRLKDVKHDPRVVGEAPARLVLPWIHRVFATRSGGRWACTTGCGRRTCRPTSTSSCSACMGLPESSSEDRHRTSSRVYCSRRQRPARGSMHDVPRGARLLARITAPRACIRWTRRGSGP